MQLKPVWTFPGAHWCWPYLERMLKEANNGIFYKNTLLYSHQTQDCRVHCCPSQKPLKFQNEVDFLTRDEPNCMYNNVLTSSCYLLRSQRWTGRCKGVLLAVSAFQIITFIASTVMVIPGLSSALGTRVNYFLTMWTS